MRILHDLLLTSEAFIFCLFFKNKQPKLICCRQKSTTALRRLNTQKIQDSVNVIFWKNHAMPKSHLSDGQEMRNTQKLRLNFT